MRKWDGTRSHIDDIVDISTGPGGVYIMEHVVIRPSGDGWQEGRWRTSIFQLHISWDALDHDIGLGFINNATCINQAEEAENQRTRCNAIGTCHAAIGRQQRSPCPYVPFLPHCIPRGPGCPEPKEYLTPRRQLGLNASPYASDSPQIHLRSHGMQEQFQQRLEQGY